MELVPQSHLTVMIIPRVFLIEFRFQTIFHPRTTQMQGIKMQSETGQERQSESKLAENSIVHTQPHDKGLGCLVLCALAEEGSRTLLDLARLIELAVEASRYTVGDEGDRGDSVGLRPRKLFTNRFLNESLGLPSPSTHCKQWPHKQIDQTHFSQT